MSRKKVVKGYMCSTDFDVELGARSHARVYPTLRQIKKDHGCVTGKGSALTCGIYEVEIAVRLKRIVKKPKF